jgi:hypothetical protein
MANVNALAATGSATSSGAAADPTAIGQPALPPAWLASAASANTVNAELATSAWGVDPSAVSGVYGGSTASGSELFAGASLLPALAGLNHSTAEQALSLLGVKAPSAETLATASASGAAAAAAAVEASGSSGAMVVDPLWGRDL